MREGGQEENPTRFLPHQGYRSQGTNTFSAEMELLSPSPPPQLAAHRFDTAPSPATLRQGFDWEFHVAASQSSEIPDGFSGKVHVAVGRSPEKSLALLHWTFRRFGSKEIGLVHVHKPSPTIPTLLGKLPASQANEEVVSAYRRKEREDTKKILLSYLSICYRAQVQANIIMIETGHIQKGIVDLVTRHGIRKLVMGAASDNCFKVRGISSKVTYTAKNAPPFCEIWFVSKGKHVWTREASEGTDSMLPVLSTDETLPREWFRSTSLQSHYSGFNFLANAELQGGTSRELTEANNTEVVVSTTDSSIMDTTDRFKSPSSTTTSSLTSPVERRLSSEFSSKEELELEVLYNRRKEALMEAERSKKEAFAEISKREAFESEAAEAFKRIKAFEAAYLREARFREELEDILRTAKLQKEEVVEQRDEAMRELQIAMRTTSILNSHAQEVAHRRDEAAGELKLVQASIATLRLERPKIRRQKEEDVRQLERWRCTSHARTPNCNRFVGVVSDSFNFTEFSLSDLQTATFDFSESFKLGQGGYGCVYKGEMLNESVTIKRLHPHNVQGQFEFQKEVHVLSKLRHPHLVTLIGVCPEALCLVYEYLPNGSLHDRLFRRTTTPPLTWKARTRIAAEISSALLFLHSSKPEKIIHGDLKPENIFLDSDFNCKIGDFGICRLVPEETMHYPFFRRKTEPKGAFPYADPEYERTGELALKSDVYSFGIIVLQLLTGMPPLGLASEVRRAMLAGNLSSILDPTAGEWPLFVAIRLAGFGLQCSEMNSRDRPDLTPVIVREMEQLHASEERPIPPFFVCPILQEIMHDPQVAADGFTYEGNALRRWLEDGHETSPMTNLKLEHLNLTPNHALRFAIQDWLCRS